VALCQHIQRHTARPAGTAPVDALRCAAANRHGTSPAALCADRTAPPSRPALAAADPVPCSRPQGPAPSTWNLRAA